MPTRLTTAILAAALLTAPARPLIGQDATAFLTRSFSDSTLGQRVLTHMVGSLSTYLVRTGVDSNPQPWQLTLPDDAPHRELLLRQLRTILRARPALPTDTLIFSLTVGPLTVSNDTARVTVRMEFGKRCPGSGAIGGFVNTDSVFVPRHPRFGWAAARSAGVRHGDRGGCAGPW